MFTADPNINDLNIRERGIFKVLFSMNIHEVATPELSTEDARCYTFFFREGSRFSAYAALYLPRTDRRFYYYYSGNSFPEEAVSEVLDEARGFAEDMGFVMDEINIAGMSLEEKNRWIEEQDIFSQKKTEARPAAPVAQPAAEAMRAAPPSEAAPATAAQPIPTAPEVSKSVPGTPEPQPQTQKKTARAPRPAPAQQNAAAPAAEADLIAPVQKRDEVISQAVKAGIVKPPKQKLKKDIQATTGVVSRDMEALARLLSSF